ncbi:ATPase AAA domain-containing protein 2 [Geranomyces variabilis]|nr:ATPase AAA domain-containing protein 2 [Geranomyces variabilis]
MAEAVEVTGKRKRVAPIRLGDYRAHHELERTPSPKRTRSGRTPASTVEKEPEEPVRTTRGRTVRKPAFYGRADPPRLRAERDDEEDENDENDGNEGNDEEEEEELEGMRRRPRRSCTTTVRNNQLAEREDSHNNEHPATPARILTRRTKNSISANYQINGFAESTSSPDGDDEGDHPLAPDPPRMGKRKSNEISLDQSLLGASRSLRNRPQVDYNESRNFTRAYSKAIRMEEGSRWPPSPVKPSRRKVPMPTAGGQRPLDYDCMEEKDIAKPLLQHARSSALIDSIADQKERARWKNRLESHLQKFPTASTAPQITFDMIGGHEQHVKTVQEMIKLALLYPELSHGAEPLKGVMFYGPPGNGKTLMARAIASSCSSYQIPVSFFECHAADVHSKWFGDSEKHLKKLFDDAKANEPSIIFFDEIDGVVPARSSGENATPHNSVVTSLLTMMDGLESRGRVIVIGATNRLDTLDPALLRPGRFDRRLKFLPPDLKARKKIIAIKAANFNLPDALLDQLARDTDGYSGADLKALASDAYYKALRRTYPQIYERPERLKIEPTKIRVTERDFYQALKDIKPSASASDTAAKPPSRQMHLLLSEACDEMAARSSAVWRAMTRRTTNASSSTLQPRILIQGPPNMGQIQTACAATNDLSERGFRLETIRRSTDLELMDVSIPDAINALQLESLPAIFIPSIEMWSAEAVVCLEQQLATAGHAILVLMTWEKAGPLPSHMHQFVMGEDDDMNGVLGYRSIIELTTPTLAKRAAFFAPLLASLATPPDPASLTTPPTALENLELAPEDPGMLVLNFEQRLAFETRCEHARQDLRRHLRNFHNVATKRFRALCRPVDLVEYPDYMDYVSHPIDLGLVMEKTDMGLYETLEDWLEDVRLIANNVRLYNEPRSDIVRKSFEFDDAVNEFVDSVPPVNRLNYIQAAVWARAYKAPVRAEPQVNADNNTSSTMRRKIRPRRRKRRRLTIEQDDDDDEGHDVRGGNVQEENGVVGPSVYENGTQDAAENGDSARYAQDAEDAEHADAEADAEGETDAEEVDAAQDAEDAEVEEEEGVEAVDISEDEEEEAAEVEVNVTEDEEDGDEVEDVEDEEEAEAAAEASEEDEEEEEDAMDVDEEENGEEVDLDESPESAEPPESDAEPESDQESDDEQTADWQKATATHERHTPDPVNPPASPLHGDSASYTQDSDSPSPNRLPAREPALSSATLSPTRLFASTCTEPHPRAKSLSAETVHNIEKRLLAVTETMNVRNLEILYQDLEGEIEAGEGEEDRTVVAKAVTDKIELCERRFGRHRR